MKRRSARLLVLLVAIVVTGVVAWQATLNERRRGSTRGAAAASDATAANTLNALADLRATLHAYVAPGQGLDFWSARAATLLADIRTGILDVDGAATIAGHPLAAQTMDDLDRLSTAEVRARAAVQSGQSLLAGDIIFSDARDRLDAVVNQVGAARKTLARTAASADVGITNTQSLLAGALLAVWLVTAILLVPLPEAHPLPVAERMARSQGDALDLSLHEKTAVPSAGPGGIGVAGSTPDASPAVVAAAASSGMAGEAGPASLPVLESLAGLCSDLGRVSNVGDLDALVGRGAQLLGATGLVVWVASPDGTHLAPAAAHGYDATTLGRIGSLPLSDENLTVAAFKSAASRRSTAGQRPHAVTVPLVSASGTVGVLAAEVPPGRDLDTVTAVAGVIAAQMATLFQPPVPTGESETADAEGDEGAPRHAQA